MLGWSPRHPGQGPAVGGDRGSRDEVGAGGQDHPAVGVVAVQVEPDDLVGGLGVAGVVLAHRIHVVAVEHDPTEPPRSRRRDGDRVGGAGIQPVHAVVTDVREHQRAVPHGVRAAAVLVHPGAHVPGRRQHLLDPPAVVADQGGAPALARATREPVRVAAVDPHLVDGALSGGERLRRDRGGPGAVGKAHRHTV